jgi:predicted metalloprotease
MQGADLKEKIRQLRSNNPQNSTDEETLEIIQLYLHKQLTLSEAGVLLAKKEGKNDQRNIASYAYRKILTSLRDAIINKELTLT